MRQLHRLLVALCLGIVRAYRIMISPLLPVACRFEPTCSQYALESLRAHGALGGGWLALKRLLRCHPFAASGYDPVPAQTVKCGNPSHTKPTP